MVIKEKLYDVIRILKANNIENAIFEAHLILRHYLKMSPTDLLLKQESHIDNDIVSLIDSAVLRRLKNEPLQYILNSQEFMGLDFYVDKNVLIPRQDTEILVEHILNHFKGKPINAIDIGTGSGCIAVSVAHFNKNAYIRALDISSTALKVAKKNSVINNVSDRISFEVADIFEYRPYGLYDLIVSNPPYIETNQITNLDKNVKDFEPVGALDGGLDGLDYYRHIVSVAPTFLKKGGMLAFEIGYTQGKQVSEMMKENFSDIEIIKDLSGNDRVVSGILKL